VKHFSSPTDIATIASCVFDSLSRVRGALWPVLEGGVFECLSVSSMCRMTRAEGREEKVFFNRGKNDLKTHAHTLSGDAGADLRKGCGEELLFTWLADTALY